MSSDYMDCLTDTEKMRIVNQFILHSPPGEFKEVLNDVRLLLNNDSLLKEQAEGVFAQYCKDQMTPVVLENSEYPVLITEWNELPGGRFYDPRTHKSFKYDPLREKASDYQSLTPDAATEPSRLNLEEAWTDYCKDHYPNGACSVFASNQNGTITLTACIEDHLFQPKNYCNGRWRSIWTATFSPSSNQVELRGIIKVQVHYYEDGNVQLVSSKEIKKSFNISNENQRANEIVQIVRESENEYQTAVSENYQTMSDTTFKALRRPLPVTKSKLDWIKILNYKGAKFCSN